MTFIIRSAVVLLLSVFPAAVTAQIKVATVAWPLGWLAQELGGDAVDIIYPPGPEVDAEFWRPGIADIALFQGADLILLNGAGFAGWTERVSLPRRAVVRTTRGLEARFIATQAITHSHGGETHAHEGVASFTWMDPALLAAQGEIIAAALERRGVTPARDVLGALEALALRVAALPDAKVATSHPRYQYFAARAGFETLDLELEAGIAPDRSELERLKASGAVLILMEQAATLPQDSPLSDIVFPTFGKAAGEEDVLAIWSDALTALENVIEDTAGRR